MVVLKLALKMWSFIILHVGNILEHNKSQQLLQSWVVALTTRILWLM